MGGSSGEYVIHLDAESLELRRQDNPAMAMLGVSLSAQKHHGAAVAQGDHLGNGALKRW